jgi:hypothetical protein
MKIHDWKAQRLMASYDYLLENLESAGIREDRIRNRREKRAGIKEKCD